MTVTDAGAAAAPSRAATRTIIVLQAIVWGGYFVGVGTLLTVAALRYGSFGFWPFGDGDVVDPKGLLGLVVHLVVLVIVLFTPVMSIFMTLAGVIRMVHDRPWTLIASTTLTVAAAIVQATPFGRAVVVWMFD